MSGQTKLGSCMKHEVLNAHWPLTSAGCVTWQMLIIQLVDTKTDLRLVQSLVSSRIGPILLSGMRCPMVSMAADGAATAGWF